jgi:dihydrodipicolinate synthase/N-acetylneuraminate lyase
MSPEDIKRNNKTLIEAVNHRIPCYPATGFYSTKTTIEVSRAAEAAGTGGWLTGSQNMFPRQMRKLYDQIRAKDYKGPRKFWYETLMPFMDLIMYGKVNGRPHWLEVFKAALNMMGHDAGEPRKPMGKLLPETEERLRKVLKTMKVL